MDNFTSEGGPDPDTVLQHRLAALTQKYANSSMVFAQIVFDGIDVMLQAANQGDPNAKHALGFMKETLRKLESLDSKIMIPKGPVIR